MISLNVVISLLFLHLVADFFLQSDWMALNKSKNWFALWVHATVYALPFLVFGPKFYIITKILHFLTDAITSRITSRLWFIDMEPAVTKIKAPNGWPYEFYAHVVPHKRHWFFVAIGCDQFIHYVTLLYTYKLII